MPAHLPDHDEVVAMLAALGDRPAEAVDGAIGSLEVTWLVTQVEQRYGVTLDLTDDQLTQMTTVPAAVATLRDALAGTAHA
jgi:acyl carrier protein